VKAPRFWWRAPGLASAALAPLGRLAAHVTARRAARPPAYISPLPVVCVGNVILGGSGKTPTVLAIVKRLQEHGHRPHILSRGYGGSAKGPLKVDPRRHAAREVGDEPLMMAAHAAVWIGADRTKTARLAEADGASVLVMDDGFQNPGLGKSFSLLVFDGARGLGNGYALPAGPLREPLAAALDRAQAALILGEDSTGLGATIGGAKPVLHADLDAEAHGLPPRVYGFCGIGNPEKFRRTLAHAGAVIAGFESFADHHRYTRRELQRLAAQAQLHDATLITTEKDAARLGPDLPAGTFVLRVALRWHRPAALDALLRQAGLLDG
jgi:tetraacyldisaccharide 4'-kinase